METATEAERPKYKPNRAERRFLDAMRRKAERGRELNPQQAAALEHFERRGVEL